MPEDGRRTVICTLSGGHAFDNILRVERGEPLPEADRVRAIVGG